MSPVDRPVWGLPALLIWRKSDFANSSNDGMKKMWKLIDLRVFACKSTHSESNEVVTRTPCTIGHSITHLFAIRRRNPKTSYLLFVHYWEKKTKNDSFNSRDLTICEIILINQVYLMVAYWWWNSATVSRNCS